MRCNSLTALCERLLHILSILFQRSKLPPPSLLTALMLVQLDILKYKIWLQRGVCLRVQRIHLLDHQEQEFQGGAVLKETGPFGHCCFLTKQSHTSDFVQDISLLETCHELFFIPLFVAKSAIARSGCYLRIMIVRKLFIPLLTLLSSIVLCAK
jgi:hypothetical protein